MSIIPNINNQSIAVLSDIEQWKEDIADAINTKGGNSTPDESFQQLAEDIVEIPYTGISSDGIVLEKPFSFLDYCCNENFNDFTEIDDDKITRITEYAFYYKNIVKCKMMSVTTIGNDAFDNCTLLQKINFQNVKYIAKSAFFNCFSLTDTNMPALEVLDANAFYQCGNIVNHSYPQVYSLGTSIFLNNNKCKSIEVGVVTKFDDIFGNYNTNLRNFKIGQGTNVNIQLQKWTATNVIAEGQSGIDELNSNLYNNLLTKLYDHSDDGETRILQIGWLNYITPENIAYANAKGWTITN